jgi:hypothetical protein
VHDIGQQNLDRLGETHSDLTEDEILTHARWMHRILD